MCIRDRHYLTDEGGALHFYDDQTDNYTQKNYPLLFNHNFTSQWNLNIGLHYTKGDGYYQEYKGERSLTCLLYTSVTTVVSLTLGQDRFSWTQAAAIAMICLSVYFVEVAEAKK